MPSGPERLRPHLLRALRVPHDPDPPSGAPGSLQVFRGGHNLYKLRLLRWSIGQVGAFIGIVISLTLVTWGERHAQAIRSAAAQKLTADAPAVAAEASGPASPSAEATQPEASKPQAKKKKSVGSRERARRNFQRFVERTPPWVFPMLVWLEVAGIALYLVQIPLTLAVVRLDYELRWYMVTDRSLRIRSGVMSIQEITMSFANIQQVVVSQGPVQRLLGLGDVRVQSAGGGGAEHEAGGGDAAHTAVFEGVANAPEIRDLILARLRQYREAGLGDPDEVAAAVEPRRTPMAAEATVAARELLTEARALRVSLATPPA